IAMRIDVELQAQCRTEAACRHELGRAADLLLRGRAYRRLGFVRLSDYARERLGMSGRTVQAAAWVARRLEKLPAVADAFDGAEISWTQTRAVCTVATAEDENRWLALAREHSVEELERVIRASTRERPTILS